LRVSKHAGKGLYNHEPATPAPAELTHLFPILKLPHRAATAPTIQPWLASASLDELANAGGNSLVLPVPVKPTRKITLDSSVIVRALSTDRHFIEARRRAGNHDGNLLPSTARKAIAMACEAKPVWVLHQEQITELREIIDGLLNYSQAVANGLLTPDPGKALLDQSAMLNAVELLDYLNLLERELCTTSRSDVFYVRRSRRLGRSG
jgi:hypothetical protein